MISKFMKYLQEYLYKNFTVGQPPVNFFLISIYIQNNRHSDRTQTSKIHTGNQYQFPGHGQSLRDSHRKSHGAQCGKSLIHDLNKRNIRFQATKGESTYDQEKYLKQYNTGPLHDRVHTDSSMPQFHILPADDRRDNSKGQKCDRHRFYTAGRPPRRTSDKHQHTAEQQASRAQFSLVYTSKAGST